MFTQLYSRFVSLFSVNLNLFNLLRITVLRYGSTFMHHIFCVGKKRTDSYDSMPEWMTDGPSSQLETIELKGFNKEIEEERSGMY